MTDIRRHSSDSQRRVAHFQKGKTCDEIWGPIRVQVERGGICEIELKYRKHLSTLSGEGWRGGIVETAWIKSSMTAVDIKGSE